MTCEFRLARRYGYEEQLTIDSWCYTLDETRVNMLGVNHLLQLFDFLRSQGGQEVFSTRFSTVIFI